MQVNFDTQNLGQTIDGNKTYLLLLGGAAVIVANHFGVIPPEYVPAGLGGQDWLTQLYALAFGAAGRSALKKLEGDTLTPDQAKTVEHYEQMLGPIFEKYLKSELDARGVPHPASPAKAAAPVPPR